MAYVAWSVVFGETPSASKWNILGTNDQSFNDGTGIAANAIAYTKLLSTIFSGQVASYTNTGTGGGTIFWLNLGGIKIAWSNGPLGNAAAWNTVDLSPVGFTSAPIVVGNASEQTGSPPGWVEFAQFSPTASGKPQTTGFSFLCRVSTTVNAGGTILFIAIGT